MLCYKKRDDKDAPSLLSLPARRGEMTSHPRDDWIASHLPAWERVNMKEPILRGKEKLKGLLFQLPCIFHPL